MPRDVNTEKCGELRHMLNIYVYIILKLTTYYCIANDHNYGLVICSMLTRDEFRGFKVINTRV